MPKETKNKNLSHTKKVILIFKGPLFFIPFELPVNISLALEQRKGFLPDFPETILGLGGGDRISVYPYQNTHLISPHSPTDWALPS